MPFHSIGTSCWKTSTSLVDSLKKTLRRVASFSHRGGESHEQTTPELLANLQYEFWVPGDPVRLGPATRQYERDLHVPRRERDGRLHARALEEGAVGRAEVLEDVLVALAPHLGVDARGERVGDAQVVARRAPDGDAQAPEREHVRSAVGVVDDQFRHGRNDK